MGRGVGRETPRGGDDDVLALLLVDAEPEGTVPVPGPWPGFAPTVELMDRLRGPLAERTGHPFTATWMLRLDPSMERVNGRADFVFDAHGSSIDHILERGDATGLHAHPDRWDAASACWDGSIDDDAWVRSCVETGLSAYRRRFATPPAAFAMGGFHHSGAYLPVCDELGLPVDVTGQARGDEAASEHRFMPPGPVRPYRPFGPGRILVVPTPELDLHRLGSNRAAQLAAKTARRLLGRPVANPVALSIRKSWPSPAYYWDLVTRMAEDAATRHRPYVMLAVRVAVPGSKLYENQRRALEHLLVHPLGRRLRFVDPTSPEVLALG